MIAQIREDFSSTPFRPCPLCGEPITSDLIGTIEYRYLTLSCPCGCSFTPGVTSLDLLARGWNERFFSDDQIEMITSSQPSRGFLNKLFRSGHFYYFLGSVFSSAFAYVDFSFSGFFLILGIFSFLYPLVVYVFTTNRLYDPVKTYVRQEFERLSEEAAQEAFSTQPEGE
ncbi:MAG: hypothetical protein SD837_21980 [Candidatus Electrothrix scaldis]|nr:MAG: hypothetical protein SD837_21980 [Candidatus Electrothrix sp. GW3-3]